jgi:hypothetical protein
MNAQQKIKMLKKLYPGKELVEFMADVIAQREDSGLAHRFDSWLQGRYSVCTDALLVWDHSVRGSIYYAAKNKEEVLMVNNQIIG